MDLLIFTKETFITKFYILCNDIFGISHDFTLEIFVKSGTHNAIVIYKMGIKKGWLINKINVPKSLKISQKYIIVGMQFL